MRRGVWLLVLGVLLAAAGAASAYGAGTGTTTVETTTSEATTPTPTTTTSTTTTATTTTATTTTATTTTSSTTTAATTTRSAPKSYSSLPASYLSSSCVGAGAAAIAEPGSRVLALGTPASSRGASQYPARAPIVRFLSASASGSSCSTARITLGSVALFGGVITAQSVSAVAGRGTVSGFAIYGSPTELSAGDTVQVGGWGQVTLGKTAGRLRAPLVVELTAAHGGLPAGTTIAFGFAASPQALHHAGGAHGSHAANANTSKRAQGRVKKKARQIKFPAAPDPFVDNDVLTPVAKHNAVVSAAIQYLGIKYQWGGAVPATGFDCSGLVTYVFAKFGVSLPHYTVSQYTSPDGVWVSPHHLEAGDLVFFVGSDGTRKAPGHVGIYVADGYFIDAPHTGSFVRIDSLKDKGFANQYVGARRIDPQLLVSRHLLGESKPKALEAAPFLHALSFQASGALPLPIAAAVPTAEHIPAAAAGSDMVLLVGGPLGALFALSAAGAGTFFVRKRRRGDLPEAPLH